MVKPGPGGGQRGPAPDCTGVPHRWPSRAPLSCVPVQGLHRPHGLRVLLQRLLDGRKMCKDVELLRQRWR